jgi:5'-nucleotidase/UDP-sugar diphosphatase
MGYTALCIGKRDLTGSTMFLLEETGKRGLRPLSSNLRYKGKAVFEPYGIFEVNSAKVGVLAVTSPELSRRIKADGVEVLDPSARLKSLVPDLKRRADVVVLLSNLGEFEDRRLASTVDGIDVIIGSGCGGQRYQPLKVGKAYLLRGNIKGKSVGKVTVKLDSEGSIQELNNELYQLNTRLPVDKAAIGKIKKLKQEYHRHEAGTTRHHPAENSFLKAIKGSKKSSVQGGSSEPNPFSQKPAPEVKIPE